MVDGDQPRFFWVPVRYEVAVPQEEFGVDLPQESSRFVDPLSPLSLGHLHDVQGGDGVDWGLTKTAGVGRRRWGVGGSRGASPVLRPWEVAARRSLSIEDYVGHLPGSPLVLKEGEELLRSATGVKWARPIAMNALSQLHWCG